MPKTKNVNVLSIQRLMTTTKETSSVISYATSFPTIMINSLKITTAQSQHKIGSMRSTLVSNPSQTLTAQNRVQVKDSQNINAASPTSIPKSTSKISFALFIIIGVLVAIVLVAASIKLYIRYKKRQLLKKFKPPVIDTKLLSLKELRSKKGMSRSGSSPTLKYPKD